VFNLIIQIFLISIFQDKLWKWGKSVRNARGAREYKKQMGLFNPAGIV
jgi:hypothetical protein